jgi:hypothetical protein
MKPKLILCLALVLSGGLFAYSAIAQSSAKPDQWQPFQILPPVTNANPSIRCPIAIRVPTKLKIERTSDTLSETIDANSFESTNLMVGTNMVTGVESKIYVYPEGESRSANSGLGLSSGLDFNLGVRYWHTTPFQCRGKNMWWKWIWPFSRPTFRRNMIGSLMAKITKFFGSEL